MRLSEERGLIVFPSNAQLSIRARGMTAATLRRHLAGLVDAGLILRKDSANGKRFARRDRAGEGLRRLSALPLVAGTRNRDRGHSCAGGRGSRADEGITGSA
ncbi:helix-turn-helix domain-containing protein [Rhizobium beringeri]